MLNLTFGEHLLRMRAWPTRQELEEFLAECGGGQEMLGAKTQYPQRFYSVTLFPHGRLDERSGIGICSESPDLPPHLLLKPESHLLYVGYNNEVAAIGVPEGGIRFCFPCDWLFSHFVDLCDWKIILAFYEVGILAVSEEGEQLWSVSTDIIVDWAVDGDRLRLELLEAAPMLLDLRTGAPAAQG
jgi:hypothetical protein